MAIKPMFVSVCISEHRTRCVCELTYKQQHDKKHTANCADTSSVFLRPISSSTDTKLINNTWNLNTVDGFDVRQFFSVDDPVINITSSWWGRRRPTPKLNHCTLSCTENSWISWWGCCCWCCCCCWWWRHLTLSYK